jgi:hypothetical protein
VTENGLVGGAAGATDVDSPCCNYYSESLLSPAMDFTGYKRTAISFDLWYYDNSSGSDYWQDFLEQQIFVDDGLYLAYATYDRGPSTSGWTTIAYQTSPWIPSVPNVRLLFLAVDRNAGWYGGAADHVVEAGVDNVQVTGEQQACASLGIANPPNPATILLGKSGADVVILWSPPAVDAFHDAAAWYLFWVATPAPASFAQTDTTTTTSFARPLDGPDEFYLVTSANAAGTSGDEPSP